MATSAPPAMVICTPLKRLVLLPVKTERNDPVALLEKVICAISGAEPSEWCPRQTTELFAAEDDTLQEIRARHVAPQLPPINVSPEEGKLLQEIPRMRDAGALNTVSIPRLSPEHLRIPAGRSKLVRVIGLVQGQIVTRRLVLDALVTDGEVQADPTRDMLKLVVVERHGRSGNIGLGLVQGFGLRRGALASSVAHDSHNLIAVGAEDQDLLVAIEHVAAIGGGLTVVSGGAVQASLALPVAGLMSQEKPGQVAAAMEHLVLNAHDIGCSTPSPFAALSFLALPVIPEIRLTDRGLVDVGRGEFVPLTM